ncbi:MAG: cyclic nucleotide-binding domain-containing protein [Planctomycetes bacterium]|nr:cyclic nucleotide-binding domain-containing protein [Planctomycetota bacterium]
MINFIEKYLQSSSISAKKILYQANNVIFSEMDAPQGMYVVESGQVKVSKSVSHSNKEMVLATYGPHEFFGEVSLIIGRPRYAKAVALTDCTLWILDKNTFKEAVARSPEFSFSIMQGLANKLSKLNEKQKEMISDLGEFTERLEDFSTLLHTFVP